MHVQIPFDTAVSASESGVSGRKSRRDIPLRTYTMTINPDDAEEVYAMLLASLGARYPVALRDWANNYTLTNEPQTYVFETSTTVATLYRTFTPVTGARSFSQRVLLIDEDDVAFSIKVNGSPLTSGVTWHIEDPGILVIDTSLTSGDILTVSGNYYVPAVFNADMLDMTTLLDGMFTINDLQLKEIPEDELVALTA
jgi:hypothetical protein